MPPTFHPARPAGLPPRHAVRARATPNLSTPPSDAARAASFPTTAVPELPSPTPTTVTGRLPPWLAGTFVRNGPGAFPAPLNHIFDGYALVAAFDIDGHTNAVTQRQRFLDTAAWRAVRDGGAPAFAEFGTAASLWATLKGLVASWLPGGGPAFGTDNASVTIRPSYPGELLAATETPAGRVKVRLADLETLGGAEVEDLKTDLICAHTVPRSDGSLVGFGATIRGGYTVYLEDATTCTRTPVAKLPLWRGIAPCWMHAFPATDAFACLAEQPLPMALTSGALTASAPLYLFDWKPEWGTRYHVVPLPAVGGGGGAVPPPFHIDTPDPLFFFHVVNAWTENDALVFDVPATDPAMVRVLSLANQRGGGETVPVTCTRLTRVRVPLAPGGAGVTVTPVFDDAVSAEREPFFFEFPTVAPSARGRKQRYVYGIGASPPSPAGNALIKIDCGDGASAAPYTAWHEPGCVVGEPLFVAPPGGGDTTREDEGVLLSLCVGADGSSFMVVVDAGSMEEVARVGLAAAVPYGFHGTWIEG